MSDNEGGFDFNSLLEQAQTMMSQAQAAADVSVVGTAGGDVVRITVTGMGQFQDVKISPAAVDPDDVESLELLVLAALHDCSAKVGELQAQSMNLDMGSIGELLGGFSADEEE